MSRSGVHGPWLSVVAAVTYGVLVLLMWAPYTLYSGLGYETAFPYMSESRSVWNGFLYDDPLRVHTNTFYQLSYLLGEAAGVGGSYVPYQLVHAALWWARGFLVFLLVRRFIDAAIVPYTAGALALVHASDGALQWVGQLNQLGFIVWMLLAAYFLVRAVDARRGAAAAAFGSAACFCEYMSLWSYESQILVLASVPVLLFFLRPLARRRLAALATAWYVVPAVYVGLTIQRYAAVGGSTYQVSVLRQDWSPGALLGDWWFNIVASLSFWRWIRPVWEGSPDTAIVLSLVGAAVFVAGAWVVMRRAAGAGGAAFTPRLPALMALLAAGLVVLALSFPVYLLLESVRGLWRTQLLSGAGAALVLTAAFGIAARAVPRRSIGAAVFAALAGAALYHGSLAAIQSGAVHRADWEAHRATMTRILDAAPGVKPGAVIVLINVPKRDDPFGHAVWLDMALRLAYPRTAVSGVYFYSDGTPAPGNNQRIAGDRWTWDRTGFGPLVRDTRVARTVIVDARDGRLVPGFPAYVCEGECPYDPGNVVLDSISPRTVRRYRIRADG